MAAFLVVDTANENADKYEKYKTLQAHCRKVRRRLASALRYHERRRKPLRAVCQF